MLIYVQYDLNPRPYEYKEGSCNIHSPARCMHVCVCVCVWSFSVYWEHHLFGLRLRKQTPTKLHE